MQAISPRAPASIHAFFPASLSQHAHLHPRIKPGRTG